MIECPDCEADLISVPVTDEEEPAAAPVQAESPVMSGGALVRLCDCGAANPPQARKCAACGEDISDVLPAPMPVQEECCAGAELVSLDGEWQLMVGAEPVEIGRGKPGCGYLQTHPYVSRTQARLMFSADGLQITSLSRTNPTFINNVPMQAEETRLLQPGDEIGLGGCVINGERQSGAAYLRVKA